MEPGTHCSSVGLYFNLFPDAVGDVGVPSEPRVEFLSGREVRHEHGTDHGADLIEDGASNQDVAPFDERADSLEVRISLLDAGSRTASVIAESPLRCLTLDEKDFAKILASEPVLATRILRGLAARLRRSERSALS